MITDDASDLDDSDKGYNDAINVMDVDAFQDILCTAIDI
jgi:hypothetical protein